MEQNEYQAQLEKLQKLEKQVRASLSKAPEGRLRAEMHKGKHPQYYLCGLQADQIKRKYIKKEDRPLAQKLAQKEYDTELLKIIQQQKKAMEHYLKYYQEDELIQVYNRLPEAKKRLVIPYVLSDEQFLKSWLDKSSTKKNSFPIGNGIITERGEEVRSKSEKMIADKFYYMGIPYKYEAPLELNNNRTIFPDFTLLNMRKRREVYLEHFGMMDDPEYCRKAIEKIDEYQSNGIYPGENLIITMESSMKPLNMLNFEKCVLVHLR